MSDEILACVRTCPTPLDLVELNRRFRWASMRKLTQISLDISGRHVNREVYSIGESHGTYNGCFGPPPKTLSRLGKAVKSGKVQAGSELYVTGSRVGRNDFAELIKSLCENECCIFTLSRTDEGILRDIRSAAKSAIRISLFDAVEQWPLLITDERQQLAVTAGEV